MPWTARFFEYGAEARFHGHTTGAEILQAKAAFYAHVFPKGARFALCDFTGVELFEVTPADVRRIINQDRAAVDSHPNLAEVVVAPSPLEFAMARMWELQIDDARPRTSVVRTRPEAITFLASLDIAVPENDQALDSSVPET